MTQFDQILTEIAAEHLGILTLNTRNKESLDFYDLAVWQIRKALKAAYDAGRSASLCGDQHVN